MTKKAAFFCHNALGDGINGLVLSNCLHFNGWQVDTYQNTIGALQNWFPHLPVMPHPSLKELPKILQRYDYYFVVQNDTDPFVLELIREGKRRFPDRMRVIYFYPSKHIVKEPYYQDCLTDPKLSIAGNLRKISEKLLRLPKVPKGSGLIPPPGLVFRKHPKRVIIHPSSSRPAKNWPKEKFLKLAKKIEEKGFFPVFVPGEKEGWEDIGYPIELFPTLDALARYIYESGYLVGNDSGLGHLASALGLPTLTLCRRKAVGSLWGPSFSSSIVLAPSSWIPNIRGFRLRDRHWKKFLSVRKAFHAFCKLDL